MIPSLRECLCLILFGLALSTLVDTKAQAAELHSQTRRAVRAPAFTVYTIHGKKLSLEHYSGHVLLLDFWASWCQPCQESFPHLEQLAVAHRSEGLEILAVTMEQRLEGVSRFLARHPVSFAVARDPTGHLAEAYGVPGMPTAILVDPQGRIVARYVGGTPAVAARMDADIESVLRGERLQVDPLAAGLSRDGHGLHAWDREFLADPIMDLNGDPLGRLLEEHIHASKEGAAGSGGLAAGGCGCE